MPNRYVREKAIESERVNQLSWQGEVFYRRLINKVDDFGRYTANVRLLRSNVFPLQIDKVSDRDISRLLSECEQAGLLATWVQETEGKPYLVMNTWELGRAMKSEFPPPPDSVARETSTHVYTCKHLLETENKTPDYDYDYDTDYDKHRRQQAKLCWTLENGWEGIEEEQIAKWKAAYPACDIQRQLSAMALWLEANPAKARKRQWLRFVSGWLSRTQERGGDMKSNPAASATQRAWLNVPGEFCNRYLEKKGLPGVQGWAEITPDLQHEIKEAWTKR